MLLWNLFSVKQGCGASTQISGFGSRHLNFLAAAPAREQFGPKN